METIDRLPDRFARAGLALEVSPRPLVDPRQLARTTGLDEIVQLDIARAPRSRSEVFRLFRGHFENRVEVLGTDAALRQLVLLIHEPRRRFELLVSRYASFGPDVRVLRSDARGKLIERTTDERKRHYLLGLDERHLFIAELARGASSVHSARESLRATEVPASMKTRAGKVIRQGEWFFLPLDVDEAQNVEALARSTPIRFKAGIAHTAQIGRGGRPHVADEIFVARLHPDAEPRAYVRGAIKHPDHKTVKFRAWTRVVPNRERAFERSPGFLWVD